MRLIEKHKYLNLILSMNCRIGISSNFFTCQFEPQETVFRWIPDFLRMLVATLLSACCARGGYPHAVL